MRLKKQATGSYVFESLYYDDGGVHQNVTAPVSLTILDGAGATVYTGTPTLHAGHLDATIPVATLPKYDTYEFIWTGTITSTTVIWVEEVELVGGYLFEISDLRTMDRAFADTTKYPTDALRVVRDAVEEVIEGARAAQVAFVPRGARVKVDGSSPDLSRAYNPILYGGDYRGLKVPDFEVSEIYSVTVNGISFSSQDIAAIQVADNYLWRPAGSAYPAWSFGHNNIELHYVHGFARTPKRIRQAALMLAREYLVKSDIPGRATATSIGDQLFRLSIAGRDGVTGLPEVDAAIDQFGRKGYAIG